MRSLCRDGRARFGLIVNPLAGMGGKVGLKGTDGQAVLAEARRRGAVPVAETAARRALSPLTDMRDGLEMLTGSGALGEEVARALSFEPRIVGPAAEGPTTAEETRATAAAMVADGVDLILFAGGDGTARDVFDVVSDGTPILGIPTGVKMHSAVFATTPENAGAVAARFLADAHDSVRLGDREIMDIDEAGISDGRLSARLYGFARVPYVQSRVQHAKAGAAPDDEQALEAVCRRIAQTMAPGHVYLFGPGTTTRRILGFAGLKGTLLGVDAALDGCLIGADLSERDILALTTGVPSRIVVSITGGQGFLFGRGNQQLSPEVIRRVGRNGIVVVASLGKILALAEPSLFVDTGDPGLDAALCGYVRVETGPDQSIMCRVAA